MERKIIKEPVGAYPSLNSTRMIRKKSFSMFLLTGKLTAETLEGSSSFKVIMQADQQKLVPESNLRHLPWGPARKNKCPSHYNPDGNWHNPYHCFLFAIQNATTCVVLRHSRKLNCYTISCQRPVYLRAQIGYTHAARKWMSLWVTANLGLKETTKCYRRRLVNDELSFFFENFVKLSASR